MTTILYLIRYRSGG